MISPQSYEKWVMEEIKDTVPTVFNCLGYTEYIILVTSYKWMPRCKPGQKYLSSWKLGDHAGGIHLYKALPLQEVAKVRDILNRPREWQLLHVLGAGSTKSGRQHHVLWDPITEGLFSQHQEGTLTCATSCFHAVADTGCPDYSDIY